MLNPFYPWHCSFIFSGQILYGRVLWNPEQNLNSAYKLQLEKVYLCTGKDGYVPFFDPTGTVYNEGPQYGCIQPNKHLKHRFLLLVCMLLLLKKRCPHAFLQPWMLPRTAPAPLCFSFSSSGVSLVSWVLVHIAKHHGREHNKLLLMSQEEGTLGRLVFLKVWPRQGGQLA